jgi:hypothetical protein
LTTPEDPKAQRVVHRSFLFVTFPVIVLGILALNLAWEILRANLDTSVKATWPFRFILLDLSTTAALFGALAGLFLARLQWAKANRPSISYVIVDDEAGFLAGSQKWTVRVHNGGPGIAIVEQYSYVVKFSNQPKSVPITRGEIDHAMEARRLVDGEDYFIREQGTGAVYPAVATYADGPMICWFNIKALVELDQFDIVLRVKDVLGDVHERTLFIYENMPSVAMKAKAKYLAGGGVTK